MMQRRSRVLNLALATLAPLALGAAAAAGATTDLLLLLPAILAFLPLLAGRYLGEERLARLARALRARTRRRSAPPTIALGQWTRRLAAGPRGGALIARSLAVRPPPASAVLL